MLQRTGGYSGDVLFENLELLRTVRAAGGTELRADDLFIARLPASTAQSFRQRVRQAYDDLAQPWRLRGGVPYSGPRLKTAAHSVRWIRRSLRG